MKSHHPVILVVILLLTILMAGCDREVKATATPTPEPISKLATHAEKPFVRGEITNIFYEDNGAIRAIHVQGSIDDDTETDSAAVKLIPTTKIFKVEGDSYKPGNLDDLVIGRHIEVLITGEIVERYPPIVIAEEILILQ